MEARGYQGGEGRTRFRILHWHIGDLIAGLVMVLLTIGL
ncbi:cobalt transport protein, partial [Listeria ivanovii FSL F6-596]